MYFSGFTLKGNKKNTGRLSDKKVLSLNLLKAIFLQSLQIVKYSNSRLLNERSGWLGLSIWDLSAIGYILIISHLLLESVGLELLSFLVAGISAGALINIRLRSRPKTIRDYLLNLLNRMRLFLR